MISLHPVRRALRTIIHPPHIRRTATITLVVGTWLTLFNQGDTLWRGPLNGGVYAKVCLNYLTPFVVANLGLLSSERKAPDRQSKPGGEPP